MSLPDYDVAVFDCDGVVLDSNRVKVEAFRWALRQQPLELVERLVDYHMRNGGISRHEKLRYFFEDLLEQPDSENIRLATLEFARYCEENLPRCPLIPGVRPFLNRLRCRKYMVTGGDQAEVRRLLEQHGLLSGFEDILGSPTTKAAHMGGLAAKGCFGGNGVYFGDARLDYDLATEHGLNFVFLSGASDWLEGAGFCQKRGIIVLRDFEADWIYD